MNCFRCAEFEDMQKEDPEVIWKQKTEKLASKIQT